MVAARSLQSIDKLIEAWAHELTLSPFLYLTHVIRDIHAYTHYGCLPPNKPQKQLNTRVRLRTLCPAVMCARNVAL
jgi:hypothetical protein